jgi:DNA polymerase-3 subunit delta
MGELKNRIYYPVYLLHGEEPYFIDCISDYIADHALSEQEKEFNQTILYGKDTDVATIMSYARRFPMMANYQVIIVREAQELDKLEDQLLPYAEHPLESTILVICYKYKKIDGRRKLTSTVSKNGIVFESARIYDDRIPEWIGDYLRRRGYTITPKASLLLMEFLGNDLGKIVNEISKLLINVPQGSEINDDYVEKNIGISKEFNVFELQKAIGSRNILKANQIVFYFAANPRENPLVKMIPILYSWMSKVLAYHYLQDKSKNAAAAALGVNPFFVSDYQLAAKNFSPGRIAHIISLLREYDLKSKGVESASVADGELMKELIFKILH